MLATLYAPDMPAIVSARELLPPVERLDVSVYRVPTDLPESDGTAEWDYTDVVVVHAHAGGTAGLGWTYAAAAAAAVIRDTLAAQVVGRPVAGIEGSWQAMVRSVRNAGWSGVCATAVSVVDIALWDLKSKLLGLSLVDLMGAVRDGCPVYGSGGFTSYDDRQLSDQLGGWAAAGIGMVKMKVGRDAGDDTRRVDVARKAIGDKVELFVDANGAYGPKQAIGLAAAFADESNVTWFEEPRSSDDLDGLRQVRDRAPAAMDVAAGEYGYTPDYFRKMLAAGAVDVMQADATRCGGYTGFLKAAALCEAFHVPLSAHCGPQLHAHVGCCVRPLRHLEYFHDHVRIEHLIFDGALPQANGVLTPDRGRAGHGMCLNAAAAERFRIG
jgi:L-alanine-DL-glutamate epimerase-like enolase superfamily enzyme